MGTTLLVDTYDTVEGTRRAARVAAELAARGGRLGGVRLDSGDLDDLSRRVRAVLDEAGLPDVTIFASGNLDEHSIGALVASGAPIDAFGVGTRLAVSDGATYFDLVYKLVDFDGRPVLKLSSEKATLPGAKQVWRRTEKGCFAGDLVTLANEHPSTTAEPLLEPAMEGGRRLSLGSLEAARERAALQREMLSAAHRALEAEPYPVEIAADVEELRRSALAAL
jgi:nicotinate phosphoribosyltransferase